MATVFYGLSGEGRGHATRARSVIEELRGEHRIKVYTYGQAYELLEPLYRDTDVEVRAIPGLRFRYRDSGKLHYTASLLGAVPYLWSLPERVAALCAEMERDQPELVITDFEPIVPRAAARLGIPFISLDHQHFLLAYDLRSLPFRLRCYAQALAPWVRLYYSGQVRTIVSSFYFPPLNPRFPGATRIGVLLRPEIQSAAIEHGDHLVAYVRRQLPPNVLRSLAECGREVRVYGLGAQPSAGNLRFRAIDIARFVEDLATSHALVSTAGNQLVGEALFLQKPVLALPEPGNREQEINGHFLSRSGTGRALPAAQLAPDVLKAFVRDADALRAEIDPMSQSGNAMALAIVRHHLSCPTEASCDATSRSFGRFGAVGGAKPISRGY